MAAIQRSSMKDQVYEIVRGRIFSGEYGSGEEVKILTLSKELGVSNTPIREALTILVAEGLLTTSLNNKFRVVQLNEKEMNELNATICILLTGGYRAAHKDGKDADLYNLLKERYDEQIKARKKGDQDEYIQKTLKFDRSFVEITGNQKLIEIFDTNNYLLYLYVRYTYWKENENTEKKLKEHEELIKAVKAENAELVQKLLEAHYDEHYERN